MNRALGLRGVGRAACFVALVGLTTLGCAAEEEGGDTNAGVGGASGLGGASGGIGGMTGGVGGATGGVGGVSGVGGAAGATGGVGGMTGGVGGVIGGMGGMTGGAGGMTGGTGGMDPDAGMTEPDASAGDGDGDGDCCPDGNCVCHGDVPSDITDEDGEYDVDSYSLSGTGCIYYPTNAEPPFAAVAISDGYLGSGGCTGAQTGGWGPFLASWGIVTMIIETSGSDQPPTRGNKLGEGIEGFKAENENSSSPLFGKLAGRYATSGFSMGGGGTTYAANEDPTLLASVAIMPWGPDDGGDTEVPTLIICGASDSTASCNSHGTPYYRDIADSVPKMRVQVSGGHRGQPTAGGGMSGAYGLAFHKVFLEGDERWRPLLVAADSEETNIE